MVSYDRFTLLTIYTLYQIAAEIDEKEFAVGMSSYDVAHNRRQLSYSRYAGQFLGILHLGLEAVLIASNELVRELLSMKREEFDIPTQFFENDELLVIHGNEIAVKMRHGNLKFTWGEDKIIAETGVLS